MMRKKLQFIQDSFGWGFLLWLFGYILGIVLFMVVPQSVIGWVLSPVATLLSIWVLLKKIRSKQFSYYVVLGIVWTTLAVVLDYLCIVKLFQSKQYYAVDVYVYYGLMLLLPPIIGWRKMKQ